jgi:hypothetical protein
MYELYDPCTVMFFYRYVCSHSHEKSISDRLGITTSGTNTL